MTVLSRLGAALFVVAIAVGTVVEESKQNEVEW